MFVKTCRGVAAGLLLGAVSVAGAQEMSYSDLKTAALAALGGDLKTIEFSGDGWDACFGQAWRIDAGWSRWEVTDFRRVIDYGTTTSLQSATRRGGLDPQRIGGCAAQPGAPASPQQTSIARQARWPEQLPIWLTPHGFLALPADGTPAVTRERRGFKVEKIVVRDAEQYKLIGYYDRELLLQRIETWIDDPIYGDLLVEAEFDGYRDFGGVKFPASFVQKQAGFKTLDLTIDGVVPSTQASTAPPPRNAPPRPAQAPPRPYTEIADGVFVLNGGYQSVAVEFADFVVLIDGMQNDARVADLIKLTHEAIPNKPIRFAVNTHTHNDHTSGLRLLALEGAIVLTHQSNVAYLEDVLNRPRTLSSTAPRSTAVTVQGVGDKHVIDDGQGQVVELHKLRGGLHAADMLVAYIPRGKTIVESDLLQPWMNPVFASQIPAPHPYLVYLYDELERIGLDYERFVPIHAPAQPPTMTKTSLREAIGR